jgi:hypothetical protein
MVTVQSGFRTSDLSMASLTCYTTAFTRCEQVKGSLSLSFWLLLYAHRHQSILGAADTSEPVDGIGLQNMVTVQSGFRTSDLSMASLPCYTTVLTRCQQVKWSLSLSFWLLFYCPIRVSNQWPFNRESNLLHHCAYPVPPSEGGERWDLQAKKNTVTSMTCSASFEETRLGYKSGRRVHV